MTDSTGPPEVEIPADLPDGWRVRTLSGVFLHMSKEATGRVVVVTYGPARDRPGVWLWHADATVLGRTALHTDADLAVLLATIDTKIFKEG